MQLGDEVEYNGRSWQILQMDWFNFMLIENEQKPIRETITVSASEMKINTTLYKKTVGEVKAYTETRSLDEEYAVERYTSKSGDFDTVNNYMRNGGTITRDQEEQISLVASFLKDAPKIQATTYRGMVMGDDEFKSFVKEYTKGAQIVDKAFMSTSMDPLSAEVFTRGAEKNIVMVTVSGKNGVAVSGLSAIKNEQEVLFNSGSKFRIDRSELSNGENGRNILSILLTEL